MFVGLGVWLCVFGCLVKLFLCSCGDWGLRWRFGGEWQGKRMECFFFVLSFALL